MSDQKLFEHMQDEHDLILVESELREIQLLCQPKWKLLSESTPKPDQLCVFAELWKEKNILINKQVMKLRTIANVSVFEERYNFTHYLEIPDKP